MDGTGDLFAPLLAEIPAAFHPLVITYPTDRLLGYDALLERIERQINDERLVLVAESFSGPLAIRYAAKHPARVRAMVLCVSFVRFPVPQVVVALSKYFTRAWPTDWMLRLLLAGWDATPEMLQLLRRTIRRVDPRVLAHRFEEVARVDAREDLRRCTAPILYLGASDDRIVRSYRRREMELIQPQMVVRKIASPHLLLQTAPAEAARYIVEFMNTIQSRTET